MKTKFIFFKTEFALGFIIGAVILFIVGYNQGHHEGYKKAEAHCITILEKQKAGMDQLLKVASQKE